MATQPVSPTAKKGIRGFLREKYDNIRSHLRTPSQQFLEVPGSRAYSKSPTPSEHFDGAREGHFTNPVGTSLRKTASLPVLVVDSLKVEPTIDGPMEKPTDPNFGNLSVLDPTPSSSGQIKKNPAWIGLGSALQALHQTAQHLPPLQSAIGGLISCLNTWEVGSPNFSVYINTHSVHEQVVMRDCEDYEALAQELTCLSKSLNQHIGESRSFRMSNCISYVLQCVSTYTLSCDGFV